MNGVEKGGTSHKPDDDAKRNHQKRKGFQALRSRVPRTPSLPTKHKLIAKRKHQQGKGFQELRTRVPRTPSKPPNLPTKHPATAPRTTTPSQTTTTTTTATTTTPAPRKPGQTPAPRKPGQTPTPPWRRYYGYSHVARRWRAMKDGISSIQQRLKLPNLVKIYRGRQLIPATW